MTLKIGQIEIPNVAGFNITQTYKNLDSKNLLRTKNGTGIMASRWTKLSTIISGSGWLPDGLDSIDENALVDIHCIGRLSTATSLSNVINIPRAFRTDEYKPYGVAIVTGDLVQTELSIVDQEATLTPVPGADQYLVSYCTIISGYIIAPIERSYQQQTDLWSWNIQAEEK